MKKPTLALFILFSIVTAQDVYLSFENYNADEESLEIWLANNVDLYGVQFTVSGFYVMDVTPGVDVLESGNMLSFNSSGLILMFGFGMPIQPGEHHFCTIYFNEINYILACFESLYFSGWGGQSIEDYEFEECLNTGLCLILGDVNDDGEIDVIDVIESVDCILNDMDTCFCADMNNDLEIDITDIVIMIELILHPFTIEDIINVNWTLDYFVFDGEVNQIYDGDEYTITFLEQNNTYGYFDCNTIWGNYSIDFPDQIEFYNMWTTYVYCIDSQDMMIYSILLSVNRFELQSLTLILQNTETGDELHFVHD